MSRKDKHQFEVIEPSDLNLRIRFIPRNPVTVCEIFNLRTSRLIVYGISRLKHDDKYDYVIGMKYALRSALDKLTRTDYVDTSEGSLAIVREARSSIWDAFFKKFPTAKNNVNIDNAKALSEIKNSLNYIGHVLQRLRTGQLLKKL